MRRRTRKATVMRLMALAVAVSVVAALVAPSVALAATPRSTIALSTSYQYKAARFRISGYVGPRYVGKTIRVEIRKPGRTWWTQTHITKINKYGRWAVYYTPKLGGKFFVRARFGSPATLSRTATLIVRNGPGVRYSVLLASTTSTRDSGLFERLGPFFRQMCPEYAIKATFVGSGAAIALGGTGDADVLLTHSPKAEADFMRGIVAGKPSLYRGASRYKVMYNDFILVGPKANPAGITLSESAQSAFGKVASTSSTFWSRNDNSGTNTKEKEIWALLGNPQIGQPWYKASGTMGMAQALAAANNASSEGYTLADRATWLNAGALGITPNLDGRERGRRALLQSVRCRGRREGAQPGRRSGVQPLPALAVRAEPDQELWRVHVSRPDHVRAERGPVPLVGLHSRT